MVSSIPSKRSWFVLSHIKTGQPIQAKLLSHLFHTFLSFIYFASSSSIPPFLSQSLKILYICYSFPVSLPLILTLTVYCIPFSPHSLHLILFSHSTPFMSLTIPIRSTVFPKVHTHTSPHIQFTSIHNFFTMSH